MLPLLLLCCCCVVAVVAVNLVVSDDYGIAVVVAVVVDVDVVVVVVVVVTDASCRCSGRNCVVVAAVACCCCFCCCHCFYYCGPCWGCHLDCCHHVHCLRVQVRIIKPHPILIMLRSDSYHCSCFNHMGTKSRSMKKLESLRWSREYMRGGGSVSPGKPA